MNTWPDGVVGIVPNRTRVIIIYPTVDPQIVVVPIISSIIIFPIVVFLVICCLRKMAARRRQLARLAQRDEIWNERSCASIVQRSPPYSFSGVYPFQETSLVKVQPPWN
ncbi:uncharacterized protein LOC118435478 isoform X2 [Folsomia candida]|uniref:uncharacterized protein LOC118435478 isoform X2 n=1 Tax=Folsomia candida TaxID=158441 RepID=UPI0016055B97|nr:uncharacterized protein LOC118435478 isoform X2 [Folsomia candida]